MSHGLVPPLTAGLDRSLGWARALNGFYTGSFNGQAAVIVFFLISGFCIHWPYTMDRPFAPRAFLLRRGIRLLLPLLVALGAARLSGLVRGDGDPLAGVPAWALVCEAIYYLLYPLLRRLAARSSWRTVATVTFVGAFLFSWSRPIHQVIYPAWGYWGDWILGLPCWLLGCVLADSCRRSPPVAPSVAMLWTCRATVFAVSACLHNLALQRIVGLHLTLNFFALLAFFWLRLEIAHRRTHPAPAALEWAGGWSYSLYLVHIVAGYLFLRLAWPDFGAFANWLLQLVWTLLLAFLFSLLFEAPAHRFARWLVTRKPRAAPVPAEAPT